MLDLSVAICTYNNATLLDRTLVAFEEQCVDAMFAWSVLVVDNNSTDDTLLVVQRYIEHSTIPGLRLICEERQGLGYARQRAVMETQAEFIAFVDDDCLLEPDWVEQAIAFCAAHPQMGAVGGAVRPMWEAPPSELVLGDVHALAAQDYGEAPCQLDTNQGLVGAGLVLRREAVLASRWLERMALVDRSGGNLTSGGDVEINLRIRNTGYELWYNPVMRLDHYIPRRRMSLSYLCRLHRGQGLSASFLVALSDEWGRQSVTKQRLYRLADGVRRLARLSLSIMIKDVLRRGSVPPRRKIAFYETLGTLEGAWRTLPKRFES